MLENALTAWTSVDQASVTNKTMGGEKLTPVVSAQQQGPPPAEAASSELWLKGHINHFTQAEQKAFDEFKKLCTDKGHYTPATADKKASHDDGTLVYGSYGLRHFCYANQDVVVS